MKNIKKTISILWSTSSYSKVGQVLNKLGQDKNDVPFYLHLLNLNFANEEENICLKKYKELAFDLREKPAVIRKLIRAETWRSHLVGNAVGIILREKRVLKDMIWRLENRSWVAPQLAVGIALLDDGFAKKKLQRIIENASEESNPKTIMSAYSSLKFLESEFANEFEKTELFNILKEKDAWDNSIDIAKHQWNFWKNIEPIN